MPEEHSCQWHVYYFLHLTGLWFTQCPFVLSERPVCLKCSLGYSEKSHYNSSKYSLWWMEQRWFKLHLDGRRRGHKLLCVSWSHLEELLTFWTGVFAPWLQSREAPSRLNHSQLEWMDQLLLFWDWRDIAANRHHLISVPGRTNPWSKCGLNKQCLHQASQVL